MKLALAGLTIALAIFILCPAMDNALNAGHYLVHTLLSAALIVIALSAYLVGYSTAANSSRDLTPIVIAVAIFVVAAGVSIRPFRTADLWAYVSYGWMQARYHLSPYGHEMIDAPGYARDPMFRMSELDELFPYGPLFAELAKLVGWLSGGNPWHAMILLKLANVIAVALIAVMTASVGIHTASERRDVILMLFLWHPLIAIEILGEGHNDLLAAIPLVLAIYLADCDWLILVIPAIALGAMVKFLPALAAPFAFIYVVKRRDLRTAILSVAIAAVVCVAVTAPYLTDWTTPILHRTFTAQLTSYQTLSASIGYLLMRVLRTVPPVRVYDTVAMLAAIAYAVFYGWELARFTRIAKPDLADLVKASALTLILFICITRMKYDAWYAAMFIPVALMLGTKSWIARAAIAIGFAGLLEPTIDQYSAPVVDFVILIGLPLACSAIPIGAWSVHEVP